MKIDQTKTKKCNTEVPSDCKALIDKLNRSDDENLLLLLNSTKTWPVGKCELFHWVEILNRFDSILQKAASPTTSKWSLAVNTDEQLCKLTLGVLHFTSLLIEYSFSRHLYSSVEHLISLLTSSNLDIVLSVLNLFYVFSKRSNFLSRLSEKQRLPLLKKLEYLAENWGGKEKGFKLATAAKDLPKSSYPQSATTLHYEFYSEQSAQMDEGNSGAKQSTVHCIHLENVDEIEQTPPEIMTALINKYPIPLDKQMLLFTHLRLAYNFSHRERRLKCIQARLHAISVLVYMNSLADQLMNIIYTGFIEELVDLLQVPDPFVIDIKAAALRTLTSVVHLDVRDRTPRVIDATGVSQYHGFLPVLVRRCIQVMTSDSPTKEESDEFSQNFSTALFSFLYHLASYESGAHALSQSGLIRPLLNVVVTMGDHQEHTTFVTRAVRLIDLITNAEWQTFQRLNGLNIFITRFDHEIKLCEEREVAVDGQFAKGKQCLPQRAALFKSVLNFLKKAISDFGDEIWHMMDGALPHSLKHIIKNVEYYGPSLFLLAIDVVTVYVFQEPSLLSVLQDNGVTEAVLNALLIKDPPATREVLASLPNIFSALCLNSRGLEAFVKCEPFKHLFQVMLNPNYLSAMRRRRSSSPMDRDTASNLGNAMDELMRHQPSLRSTAMAAIVQLLSDLEAMGSNPSTVCAKPSTSKADTSSSDMSVNIENVFEVGDESDDEKSIEDEAMPAAEKRPVGESSKKQVPLLEYIHNVVKFVQAIISNNATDDHCREFQQKGGLPKLFALLRMPALPLDFPTSPACQAIANLMKSIFTLSKQTAVFSDGLKDFQSILINLEPIYERINPGEGDKRSCNSYLLRALSNTKSSNDVMEMDILKSLMHAHAFVNTFMQLSRTSQAEVRTLLLKEWASETGLDVLDRMNKLYCSLIWESTMLLKLCSAQPTDKSVTAVLDNMFTVHQPKDDKATSSSASESPQSESAIARIACEIVSSTYVNSIRPILTASSKLGRSLAELFGLLIKLSVGLPLRQRYRDHPSTTTFPSKEACSVAKKLSQLLNMGLSWVPEVEEMKNPRITFLLCTIGFTMSMLFDDRHMSYHLMLQYFESSGAHKAFFDCFTWALSIRSGNAESTPGSETPELPGNLDSLFETWLTLLQHLVNPQNILESTHAIPTLRIQPQQKFVPVKFLLKTHKAALQALKLIWSSEKLKTLTDPMFDSLMTIQCHLIQGEKIIKKKLTKEKAIQQATPVPATTSTTTAAPYNVNISYGSRRLLNAAGMVAEEEPPINESHVQQLTDMGFTSALAREALSRTDSLEVATEWLLTHSVPNEEDQLMRAISLSLSLETGTDPVTTTPSSATTTVTGGTTTVTGGTPAITFTSTTEAGDITSMTSEVTSVTSATTPVTDAPAPETSTALTPPQLLNRTTTEDSGSSTLPPSSDESMSSARAPSSDEATGEVVMEEMASERQVEMMETDVKVETKSDVESNEMQEEEEDESMESYISGKDMDEFTSELFQGCSQLLDYFPFKVHRVCDLVETIMKRNDEQWRDSFLNSVISEIQASAGELYKQYTGAIKVKTSSKVGKSESVRSTRLLTRCVLLSLMFESRPISELCRSLLKQSGVIDQLLELVQAVSKTWATDNNLVETQEWVSVILILVDVYQRACIRKIRTDNLAYLNDRSYDWKWFDDRWGRWCPYNPNEQKQIDEAYKNNQPDVRFSENRRRYHIHFNEMTQINVENGAKKSVIMMYKRNKEKGKDEDTHMDTDENHAEKLLANGVLDDEHSASLVRICTQMLTTAITKDALHSVMRLLLRLTRSDLPKGYERANLFMQCGGPTALLKLKKKNGFDGFMAFATLLFSQMFEDKMMLRQVMEKAIRNIPLLNSPRISFWRREMYHFLLMMSPMACRDPHMFAEVMKSSTKVMLPNVKLQRVEEEEKKLVGPKGVQLLQVKPGQSKNVSKIIPLNDTSKQLLDLLLLALVDSGNHLKNTTSKDDQGQLSDIAQQLRNAGDTMQTQYDEELTSESTNKSAKTNDRKDKGKKDSKPAEDEEAPLINRTFILQLLTELVTSYPACVSYIASYVYQPEVIGEKTSQSCIVYILHNILPPACEKVKTNDRKNAISPSDKIQNENGELAKLLLTNMVCSHHRPKVNQVVFTEIRNFLRQTMMLPESNSKHLVLRTLLKLINNILVGSTKQTIDSADKGLGEKSVSIPQLMINKGLPTEIAFIPNFIDLGSPNMADTINAVLEPLTFLSRQVFLNASNHINKQKTNQGTPAPSSGGNPEETQQEDESEPVSEAATSGSERIYRLRMSPYDGQDIDEGDGDDGDSHDEAEDLIRRAVEGIDSLEDFHFHDPGMIELNEDDESSQYGGNEDQDGGSEDLDTGSEDLDAGSDDLEESTNQEEEETQDQFDDDDDDSDTGGRSGAVQLGGADTSEEDSSSSDDATDDDGDADGHDEQNDNVAQRNHTFTIDDDDVHNFDAIDSLDYDVRMVDVLLNDDNMETGDYDQYMFLDRASSPTLVSSNIVGASPLTSNRAQRPLIEFQEVNPSLSGNSSLFNSASWFVPDRHPLLRRQVAASRGTSNRSNGTSTAGQLSSTTTGGRPTVQIEFRGNSMSNNASEFLHRLLAPIVSSDVLNLTNFYQRERNGGHARVIINASNMGNETTSSLLEASHHPGSNDTSLMVPSSQRFGAHMPPLLLRWSQTSSILEADSIMLCALSVREDIVDHLEHERDLELEERRKKREQEKKEQAKKKKQKEEEDAKKKKEQEEKDDKETKSQDDAEGTAVKEESSMPQEEQMTVSPVRVEQSDDAIPATATEASATGEVPQPADETPAASESIADEPPLQTVADAIVEEQLPTVTTAAEGAAGASSSATGAGGFGSVDPSFLEALPDDIRQEVIREQLSHQGQTSTSGQRTDDSNTISAEFLAALPPSIQQEVLAQQRAEQARRSQATSSTANEPVDPTSFIQTLPSNLRQAVLSDIDDSLLAMLPSDIAQEAQRLRQHQHSNIQNMFMGRSRPFENSFRQAYGNSSAAMNQFGRNWGGQSMWMPGSSTPVDKTKLSSEATQLLSRKALVCLIMLLFIDDSKVQLTKLCKILRNLSWHEPTLLWLVHTLVDILQHSAEPVNHTLDGAKPSSKISEKLNLSWRSIRLDSALGSRVNIFHVEEKMDDKTVKTKQRRRSNKDDFSITIRQQAAPIVCKNVINILMTFAKCFHTHFAKLESKPGRTRRSDFWNILIKLENIQLQDLKSERRLSGADLEKKSDLSQSDFEHQTVSIGELVLMLGHPVIQQSQVLTDKLLTLLAQVSSHLPDKNSSVQELSKGENKAKEAKDASEANSQSESGQTQTNSSGDESGAATMGAQAQTSNTSTTRYANMNTLTNTTDSGQNLGSKSMSAIALKHVSTSPLENELGLVVNILTSHACTEAGLEDATELLINLSRAEPQLRKVTVKHLLKGAQELGRNLCILLKEFSEEIAEYNKKHKNMDEDKKDEPSSSRGGPSLTVRDPTMHRSKDTTLDASRDLQLPMMQKLTSKTSHQAFFLRLLKVIILLQNSTDKRPPKKRSSRYGSSQNSTSWPIPQNLRGLIRPDEFHTTSQVLRRSLLPLHQSRASSQSSTSGQANKQASEPEEGEKESLSTLLDLDELWKYLSLCLVQLEASNDQHAVLVLQPTVEAFFMVHATKPKAKKATKENLESQLEHLERAPLSPVTSDTSTTSSRASTSHDDLSEDGKKFVDFADKHRGILNQILRQSSVPLTEGPFAVLVDYTKVLDFDVKRQHFRRELEASDERSNQTSRRDDIAIRIRRQHVFEDSFRDLHRRTPEELKSRLYIVFEGEEGQDAGGLLREWYLIISREIFNPMYALFRISPGDRVTYTINPLSYINPDHLSYFKFVGNVVAKAIYDNKLLDCYFTRSFYKHILGKPVRYADMESEDYTFSQSLKFLLENDVSVLGSELNFSVEVEVFGKMEVHDLKPNGRNIPVTEENKREYVHLVCREKMTAAITKQISAFLEGFYEVIPKRLISIFDEQELELLISGLPNVDIDDLRSNTEYHKYQTSSLQIQWFWRALKSFDQAERAKFLQFVTGTSKVPLQGFATLEGMTGPQKFQIHRDSRSTSRLPCAHTCFNQLDLPAYESYDKLRHMLLLAINECSQGFGLA